MVIFLNEKILVLMSTYNGEKYLKDQVNSIFDQKGKYDVNLLIRDDGSIDKTVDIIKKLSKSNKRIKYVIGKNIGCNASYFELFKIAIDIECDFIAISDQDDIWLNDKLLSAMQYLTKKDITKPVLYGSASYLVKNDLIPYGKTQTANKEISIYNTIIQNFFPGHSQVFNKVLLKYLIKDLDITNIYVYDSWITNVANNFGDLIFDNNPHTLYRMHENNVVGYSRSKMQWFKARIRRLINGDVLRQAKQIEYFIEVYKEDLNEEFVIEMEKFLNSRSTIFLRIQYLLHCKLYRQKKVETLYFKLLYLFGKYDTSCVVDENI